MLHLRQVVRRHILRGDVDGTLLLLTDECPQLKAEDAVWEEVNFYLGCQKYIELVR